MTRTPVLVVVIALVVAACGGASPEPARETAELTYPSIDPTGHLLHDVRQVSARASHTCALLGDDRGQLGNGGRADFIAPVRVDLPIAVRTIVAGDRTPTRSASAATSTAGRQHERAAGDGTTSDRRSAQVVRMREPVLDLAADARHTCVVVAGGDVRCWGDNRAGQLGDGTEGDRSWPLAVLDEREEGEAIAAG